MSVRVGLRLSLACIALVAVSQAAFAQTRVAVLDLQRSVLESAEIQKASADMEAKYKPRQDEIERIQKELMGLQQQLQTMAGKLTPQAEADIAAQGQRRQRDLQRLSDDLQSDVEQERNEILSRSSLRMRDVVRKIAEEKNIDLVVDINDAIFFKPALDITDEAMAAYNKAHPPK
jgi:outer membrane protein